MSFKLPDKKNTTVHLSKNSLFKSILKWCGIIIAVLIVLLGGVASYSYWQTKEVANAAKAAQTKVTEQKPSVASARTGNVKYLYGANNDGIPNAQQLAEYQSIKSPMTTWGYAAAPTQSGLDNAINALPINEGASNQTLAWGWGTVMPGYQMGKANNILAAHNFADGITYASPLQYIDVSKKPKFYQTDGSKLYTYELTKREVVNAISREYTDAVQQSAKDKVTLITCDEPNFVVNLHTEKRIVVSGDLVETTDYKKAPTAIKALFPNF